ncbi:ABC transporter ATP-binding protein [Nocardioides daeguensis]|uniref:ABC transporter ATP-binding protein n=1 Tax=Nocardioides daeguensis TaxID=908359 RepID=A0ABP6W9A6_9ACTN|nr:ABC transporter ATP-binding protein [Nocardioides daeguensis]MBV6729356.1 ABC transporter ATP-binding protein [Nocardioides daeguensis]MCR1774332.1 ABC transporter ATP-binding protein [Nocardioides daeguensis]
MTLAAPSKLGSGLVDASIDVTGARRTYELPDLSHLVALHDVDLSIESGTFVSVIGPSGCGKSTLLRIIGGLEQPDAGSVTVCGVSPKEAAAAKALGFVPQTPALLPWLTVLKNVTLPTKVNKRRNRTPLPDMEDLLRKAGLGDAMHKLPLQLSGGMQQRAAIVRAFGLRPDVMLMDEPFSALDEFTREALQEQLLDLWEETRSTVVFVTHSVSEAVRLSDRVVVMAPRPGRIVDVIDVDLPRPRPAALLESPEFHHYEGAVRDRLREAFEHGSRAGAAKGDQ